MSTWAAPREEKTGFFRKHKEKKQKRAKLCKWHKFVLLVGYATLLYGAARAVIYLLVLLEGKV